jgi:hypothetical protein
MQLSAAPVPPPSAAAVPTPKARDTIEPQPPRRQREAESNDQLRPLSYGAVGVGAAGMVAFGVLGAMSHAQYDRLARACPGSQPCDPALAQDATRGRTYQTIANVSLAIGVAALTAGVVLWLVSLPGERATLALKPGGAELAGRF